MITNVLSVFYLFLLLTPTLRAQGVRDLLNTDEAIRNEGHLAPFLESLFRQQTSGGEKISIVHIGDSHIQADYLTGVMRRRLQSHFGNAGRGLVVPLRVAKTNEPSNYTTSSAHSWSVKRCIDLKNPLPTGIGGITLVTTDPSASIDIRLHDRWSDNLFTNMTVHALTSAESFDLAAGPQGHEVLLNRTDLRYSPDTPATVLTIRNRKNSPTQRWTTLFGVQFENGRDGILYHAIGVNSARYLHYDDSVFTRQTRALIPRLIILSLGSNEAFRFPNLDRHLRSQIAGLAAKLKKDNPEACIMFVTPTVGLIKNEENPGVKTVRDFVVEVALAQGYAYYDLFNAMGGPASAAKWQEEGLLSQDGIHFTRQGYELLGDLLFEAIMKSYQSYVLVRHR